MLKYVYYKRKAFQTKFQLGSDSLQKNPNLIKIVQIKVEEEISSKVELISPSSSSWH